MPKVACRQSAPEARQRQARRQGEPLGREGRQPEGLRREARRVVRPAPGELHRAERLRVGLPAAGMRAA